MLFIAELLANSGGRRVPKSGFQCHVPYWRRPCCSMEKRVKNASFIRTLIRIPIHTVRSFLRLKKASPSIRFRQRGGNTCNVISNQAIIFFLHCHLSLGAALLEDLLNDANSLGRSFERYCCVCVCVLYLAGLPNRTREEGGVNQFNIYYRNPPRPMANRFWFCYYYRAFLWSFPVLTVSLSFFLVFWDLGWLLADDDDFDWWLAEADGGRRRSY